jgi:hypothetical protein
MKNKFFFLSFFQKPGGLHNSSKGYINIYSTGEIYKARNGYSIQLWNDVWIGNTPMRMQFPNLTTSVPYLSSIYVKQAYGGGSWDIQFWRCLFREENSGVGINGVASKGNRN